MHSPFLDLAQKIRFISYTCANLAICFCSWGLLTSLAVHRDPLLTDVNNSLHCLYLSCPLVIQRQNFVCSEV